jgi:hypothetical protein
MCSGDKLSPWFRAIERNLLHTWWQAMEGGNLMKYYQPDVIHRADSFERTALEGVADSAAASTKQGAYGKVPIHKHSVLSQLAHLDEVWAVVRMLANRKDKVQALAPGEATPSLLWCEEKLTQVSRSFAMVIRQLPPVSVAMARGVCVARVRHRMRVSAVCRRRCGPPSATSTWCCAASTRWRTTW